VSEAGAGIRTQAPFAVRNYVAPSASVGYMIISSALRARSKKITSLRRNKKEELSLFEPLHAVT